MTQGAAMGGIDWFGADGGKLWAAAATGATGCFTFIMGFVYIAFRFVTRSHEERLKASEEAHEECKEITAAQHRRIEALEIMLWQHGPSQIRKELGAVISELHLDVRRIEGKGDTYE